MYSKAQVASASATALQGLRGGPWGPVRAVPAGTREGPTQEEASIVQLQQLSAHGGDWGTGAQGAGEDAGGPRRERGPLVVVPEELRAVVERQRQRIAELTAQVGELTQVRVRGLLRRTLSPETVEPRAPSPRTPYC